MRVPGFIGGSNEEQSYIAGQERTVNWYVAPLTRSSPNEKALFPTPGVERITLLSATTAGRAHAFFAGREWAVEGGTLYEIDAIGGFTDRGTVAVDDNPATISYNGDGGGELLITSGGNGYIYTLATDVLTQISALDGIANQGDHIDGYFLALDFDTSTVSFSGLLDGTTWSTGSSGFQRSAASDPWKGMRVLNGELIWLWGEETAEVWYNAGTFPVPFEPHPAGRGIEYGIDGSFSSAIVNGILYWLGSTASGQGMVLSTTSFAPKRISTPSVERIIGGYAQRGAAVGDAYYEEGHEFYLLSIPDGVTWSYDASTQQWHERATWIVEDNEYVSWRPRHHAYAFGEHRWLDREAGALYRSALRLSLDVDSRPLRRLRRGPAAINENKRFITKSFELLMDVGVGGLDTQPSSLNPAIPLTLFTGASFWAYYEFQADGTDENAGGSDLTEVNGPAYLPAVHLNGAQLTKVTDITDSPYLRLAAGSAGNFDPGTASFVAACKVRFDSLSGTNAFTLMSKGEGFTGGDGWQLWAEDVGGVNAILNGDTGDVTVASADGVVAVDGTFYVIVLSVDRSSDVATIYVNGTSVATGSTTGIGSIAKAAAFFGVGAHYLSGGAPLDGRIDQVVFAKGIAWSAGEVATYGIQGVDQSQDPQVMMRFSDDGGKSWSAEYFRSAGKVGEYDTRVHWDRLGQARKRVYEIVVSDPVPWRIVDAFMEIEPQSRWAS